MLGELLGCHVERSGEQLERAGTGVLLAAGQAGEAHWSGGALGGVQRSPAAELRDSLDERHTLASAGVRDATRGHLVAATIIVRGPTTAEQARELMAEKRRAEAFRRALGGRITG